MGLSWSNSPGKMHGAPATAVNDRVHLVASGAGRAESGGGHLERGVWVGVCAGGTVGCGSGLERRGLAGFATACMVDQAFGHDWGKIGGLSKGLTHGPRLTWVNGWWFRFVGRSH
jgi:hypothetical protein